MTDTQLKLNRVESRVGPIALVTIDNGEDWTKPTFFGEQALQSLERALDELERGGYRAALLWENLAAGH